MRTWNRTDDIGVQSHVGLVTGDGFNGTSPMDFELRDGRIASLRIR